MESQIYDEIEFETVRLEVAHDVVVYSFIAQKSLTHLDLSTCEYTMQVSSIFTEEQCRKLFEPRRQILYTLNLDLPKNLERSLRTATLNADDQDQHQTFHLGVVFVCECLYTRNLASCMIKPILLAENKIEKLKRYLKVIKLLRLDRCRITATFLFDHLILVLYSFCMDSSFVMEFSTTLQFCYWIFIRENPVLVDYILHHALLMRYDILQVSEQRLDPINSCILFSKPGNISILLLYGTVLSCQPYFYIKALRQVFGIRRIMRIVRKNIHHRRLFLILQAFCYFLFNDRNGEGLIHIWRTIPDPSLTENEIFHVFDGVISLTELNILIGEYKSYIIEETDGINDSVPRTLQHLCRVNIRNILHSNNRLPFGISQLHIPPLLKDYLNLQR